MNINANFFNAKIGPKKKGEKKRGAIRVNLLIFNNLKNTFIPSYGTWDTITKYVEYYKYHILYKIIHYARYFFMLLLKKMFYIAWYK